MTTRIEEHRGAFRVERLDDVEMAARDGVVLRCDLYRPVGVDHAPVLVRRTPYGKRENDLAAPFNEAHFFASHGYLVVVQDTRGRYRSDGEWTFAEGPDTYDTIEWAATLDACTGAVGTFGQSYGALVQYLAAAMRPPHLRTCIPISGPFPGTPHNGFVDLAWNLGYGLEMAVETHRRAGTSAGYEALCTELLANGSTRFSPPKLEEMRLLPLTAWGDRVGSAAQRLMGSIEQANRPIASSEVPDSVFAQYDVPMLHVGSWYDSNQLTTTSVYEGMRDHAATEFARRNQALLMGPWAHLLPYNLPTSGGTGEIDFGPDAAIFLLDAELQWFDHYLRRAETSLPRPRVRIFVIGENRWRDEDDWPLRRAAPQTWYLHSEGTANSSSGDGTLSIVAPGDEPPDRFRYDPADPVITSGGHYIVGGEPAGPGGVYDQRPNESRDDVLVYTSDVLERDLELVGPVSMRLFASTSAADTDFHATLVSVHPDGYAQNLVEGAVRLRHRTAGAIMFGEPGVVYELQIDLWSACHLVPAGHRLRVHITSSDFPRWDRNANTGAPIGGDRVLMAAEQTVLHDTGHPSSVTLSVVPR